tara:strand:+ start:939 stop:1352 length:414 start_codon:yes stop_codon:yes gene_type:complete
MKLIERNTTELQGKKVFFSIQKLNGNILTITPSESIELFDFKNGQDFQTGESFIANQLTKNNYYSKTNIQISLDGLTVEVETLKNGKKIIFLNEDFYFILKDSFNVNGKIFSTWKGDGKATAHLAICKHIKDYHDIG